VSGSGGYGDPLERSADHVAVDVALGHVSVERAREAYGAVVDATGVLDRERTDTLRRQRAGAKEDTR
jgi:N-methylhydantoinase B